MLREGFTPNEMRRTRKHWDECPGVFCLGEVAKEYSSPARGSPLTSPRWRRLIGVSVCPSTLTGTRPKGDGMELTSFLGGWRVGFSSWYSV